MSEQRPVHSTLPVPPLLRVMFLLALTLALHQVVMASPAHVRVMPMLAAQPVNAVRHRMQLGRPVHGDCDHCPVSTTSICPAVQATLPAILAGLVLLFACLSTSLLAVSVQGPRTFIAAVWHPPPRYRLVLFQTFRC